MNAGKIMFGLMTAAIAVPAALAQQATPTPTRAPPPIITLPDTGTGTFTLAPRATPTPTPTPAPSPAATPTAAATTPVPRAAPAPRAAASSVRRAEETRAVPGRPRPGPTPLAVPAPTPLPIALPTSLPAVIATPAAPVGRAPSTQQSPWLWALLGAGAAALAGFAAWLLLRRRRLADEAPEELDAGPVVVPAAPRAPSAPAAPLPRPAVPSPQPAGEPFQIGIQPLALEFGENEIVLDIELLIANLSANPADAVRVSTLMISANADQDAQIAAFQARSQLLQATDAFDLAAGAGGRLPARLTLPREQIEVVTIGGRPMFVPLVMVAINWRGGLAVRRFGASFMVGPGGQGGKLGPVWLDRPAPRTGLAATRYLRREAVAA